MPNMISILLEGHNMYVTINGCDLQGLGDLKICKQMKYGFCHSSIAVENVIITKSLIITVA